ncbi:hypothetical protein [Mesorhizobium carmichaelinearum]|uniref:hypothetical protein n=1 Tax=Mesorhizobium carmichaelinearum TaxID=1208188 RepID=UPI00117D8DDC|nr:hypothetical protein [Mesorhizobium carmichaelinearum]
MTEFDLRPTLNVPTTIPLWLEEVEGERALGWTARQAARTLENFGGAQFKRDCAAGQQFPSQCDRLASRAIPADFSEVYVSEE